MRFSTTALLTAALTIAVASVAHGAVFTITNDTYVDSFYYATTVDGAPFVISSQNLNFGNSGAVKAVSNNGSGSQYPLATSLVRGMFTLPAEFWTALGSDTPASAIVTYRVRNNSLAGRGVELHPLTRTFIEGSGGTSTTTQGGTANTPAAPLGADWNTYDGINPWATPGGDFDSATLALATLRTVGTAAYLDWNIAPLLADPAARSNLQANGLLLRVTNETNYTGNEFVSLWTAETANAPTVTFTAVPEPTGLALFTPIAIAALRRKRRSAR